MRSYAIFTTKEHLDQLRLEVKGRRDSKITIDTEYYMVYTAFDSFLWDDVSISVNVK